MNTRARIPTLLALSLAFTGCNEDGTFFPDVGESGGGDTEGHGTNDDSGTGTTDSGAGTTDSGAGTTDSGAGTTDSGTGTTDSGTGTSDSGTGTTDSDAGTTDSGTGTSDSGTGTTDSGTRPVELTEAQRAIVAAFCDVYQRCDPEGFGEYYASIDACVDEFTTYFAEYAEYGADCLDAYLAFIDCAASQPTCDESFNAYQNACRELYAAIDDACDFYGGDDDTDYSDAGFPPPRPDAG